MLTEELNVSCPETRAHLKVIKLDASDLFNSEDALLPLLETRTQETRHENNRRASSIPPEGGSFQISWIKTQESSQSS